MLLVCLLVAGFWEVMAYFSAKPGAPLRLSAENFAGFQPRSPEWSVRLHEMEPEHPSVENILVYELKRVRTGEEPERESPAMRPAQRRVLPSGGAATPVLVRLVYGYNMPDCMKLKGYRVELIGTRDKGRGTRDEGNVERGMRNAEQEHRPQAGGGSKGMAGKGGGEDRRTSNVQHPTPSVQPETGNPGAKVARAELPAPNPAGAPHSAFRVPRSEPPGLLEVWRLTSDIGEKSVWMTAMVRSGDFEWTEKGTRDMPFPRIAGTLEDGWEPTGFSTESLRHPVLNFKRFMLTKWNNSRCDLLTFLRLRKGAWVSQDILTLVSRSNGPSVSADAEPAVTEEVLAAHLFIYEELLKWKQSRRD